MSDADSQTDRRPGWRWSPILHAAAVLVHPLSAFLLPWRAGERDARMAIGLLRVDPVRRRSMLCALCYLSVGAGKVMLSGFAVFFIVLVALKLIGLELQPGVGWLGEAVMALVTAVVIAAASLVVLTFVALLIAALIGQKIWIDDWADPSSALDGRWPPITARETRRNWAALLAGIPSVMIPVTVALIVVNQVSILLIWASGLLGAIPAAWMARRIAAQTPAECYPESSHPKAAEHPVQSFDVLN